MKFIIDLETASNREIQFAISFLKNASNAPHLIGECNIYEEGRICFVADEDGSRYTIENGQFLSFHYLENGYSGTAKDLSEDFDSTCWSVEDLETVADALGNVDFAIANISEDSTLEIIEFLLGRDEEATTKKVVEKVILKNSEVIAYMATLTENQKNNFQSLLIGDFETAAAMADLEEDDILDFFN